MKKIFVNSESWQTRVAVLRNDKLQDIYFDSNSKIELERSFFKGKVVKVLPGIQTAFVEIGQSKAGFLHITEIDRALATEKLTELIEEDDVAAQEKVLKSIKKSMVIEKILKAGDEILVQVLKEPVYEKGAKLTTCFAIPGKFIVLMPNIPQIGVSKKIENREERSKLKKTLASLLNEKMGAIVRTTAEGRKEKDLKKDLGFLISTWNSILKKFKRARVGEQIHEDLPITIRVIREHLDEDVESIVTDKKEAYDAIRKFVKYFMPEQINKVKYFDIFPPIFEKFNIDNQIVKALQKKVELRSGGSLIIETTEAMSVIDVNTGKFTGKGNMEETILQTNLEAAEEVVTQLRLRNIGGLIVIDFIDMYTSANKQKLFRFLEKTLKERDKYQSVILKISEFGLVQMTRKRSGKTLVQQLTKVCPTCHSTGFINSDATISYNILKQFKADCIRHNLKGSVILTTSSQVFNFLIQKEYISILNLEKELECKIILENDHSFNAEQYKTNKVES